MRWVQNLMSLMYSYYIRSFVKPWWFFYLFLVVWQLKMISHDFVWTSKIYVTDTPLPVLKIIVFVKLWPKLTVHRTFSNLSKAETYWHATKNCRWQSSEPTASLLHSQSSKKIDILPVTLYPREGPRSLIYTSNISTGKDNRSTANENSWRKNQSWRKRKKKKYFNTLSLRNNFLFWACPQINVMLKSPSSTETGGCE